MMMIAKVKQRIGLGVLMFSDRPIWKVRRKKTTTLRLINVIRSTSTSLDILHGDPQNWNVSSLQKLQSSVCVPENCALKEFCFPE